MNKNISTRNKSMRQNQFIINRHTLRGLILFSFFIAIGFSVNGQTPDKEKPKFDKASLSIKPNSRDESVMLRNNSFQRANKHRDPARMMKMKQVKPHRVKKSALNANRRQQTIQRRQQMNQQRRALRR